MTDIAIVGIDCRFPKAANKEQLWDLLLAGADGIGEVPTGRWRDPGELVNHRSGGFIADADAFDHEFFGIPRHEAAAMDPQQRLLLQTAWRALEDAALDPRAQAGSATGVFVGVMSSEWAHLQLRDLARITPQLGTGNGQFMTANRLSYQLDLKGPSMAVDTACSSSLVAVQLACDALRADECDQALAGGVNLALTPVLNVFYTRSGLSAPDGRCKPFSGRADGIGRGEGVAVLVLRRLADAVAEGLPVYAVIKGGSVNSDGRSNGITAPSRWSQQEVIAEAHRRAGVRPEDVAFVEAHGTGTVLGDMIEAKALGHVHGVARSRPCAIGSIKGNLGHTEGAAGIAGLIKVALALRHRVVPPSRYAEDVNPRLKLADHGLELLRDPLELPATGVVHAAVSSFGLGGTNAHLLLSTGPAEAPVPDRSGGGLLTLSAPDADGLRRNAARMAEFLDSAEAGLFSQHCWTSNQVKASGRYRLAVPAADRDLAVAALRGFTEARPGGRVATGWLFTGQGAQYPGMSLALHQTSGAYRRALSEVDEIMRPHLGGSVRELILGDERINRTEFAQPALFAVEYALARVLVELGIEPAWLLGHSIGEYAVAVLAGVFTVDDACRLVTTRGRLMQALPSGGGMLAVSAEVPADLLADEPQVDVAAVNGPQAVVLSGPVDALDRIARRLRGVPTRRLAVSHAFHSPLVEPMLAEFAEIAQDIDYRQPEVPIYSTVRGGLLAEPMDAAYWTEQIRATVRFADAVRNALEAQATHLVEIGPQRTLATLVARLRADLPCLVPCPGPKARGLELAEVVATLHQDGLDPAWDVLYEREHRVRRRLPGHEFSTTNRFWFHDNTASDNTEPANEVSLNDVIALFQQQNAILAKFTGGTPPPPSTPTPAEPEDSAEQVLEQVARISGLPAANLQGGQRLAELGLDSIMIAELLVALRRSGRTVGQVTGTTTLDELAAGEPRPAPGRARPEICPAVYRIEEFPEVKATAKRLAEASRAGVSNPYFLVNDGIAGHTSIINGREVLNFSSYNYLGLSGHPTVVREVQDAVARYGSSCSASRIISGEKPIHRQLETELAALLGTEDAIALVSGHATNVTVIGHLLGPDDLVLHDSLAHNSILQGCQLSGATRRPFPHNDHAALDALLDEVRHRYRRVLIVLEGVYSQDGDIPDLPAFVEVKRRHRALLMVDEAHSIGVLGATGGGIGEHFGVRREDVELWCGTMSKALAGCGGYVAGSQQLVRYFKYTAPGFVYSVGMTPPNAAASLAAIRQLRAEPERVTGLRERGEVFLRLARDAGLNTGDSAGTPIIPCVIGDSWKTVQLSNELLRRGINVNPILHPAVPEELARLRFFITVEHTVEQLNHTVTTLTSLMGA